MHQQIDEANIPPARIPRRMFFFFAYLFFLYCHRSWTHGTVTEEFLCAILPLSGSRGPTWRRKWLHGIQQVHRTRPGWKYHRVATF
jgi:hypothetical protein